VRHKPRSPGADCETPPGEPYAKKQRRDDSQERGARIPGRQDQEVTGKCIKNTALFQIVWKHSGGKNPKDTFLA